MTYFGVYSLFNHTLIEVFVNIFQEKYVLENKIFDFRKMLCYILIIMKKSLGNEGGIRRVSI